MTKNPSEIKSLRSSCLFTENNLASPSDRLASYNRQGSLEVSQALQGLQHKTISPEVFENVYLKQSYMPQERKSTTKTKTKTNSHTLKTTKR